MPTPLVLPRHPLIGMVLIAVLLATAGPALTADVTGQASVIDGDTIEIHGTRIRLWGIDAPEGTQLCRGEDSLQYRCGAKAANDLDAFIARRSVSCTPISLDQYGRTVATCSVEATDLGEWLVSNGLRSIGRITRKACTRDPTRRRTCRARYVVGQLRSALAISNLHPVGWPSRPMFGRRERASIRPFNPEAIRRLVELGLKAKGNDRARRG